MVWLRRWAQFSALLTLLHSTHGLAARKFRFKLDQLYEVRVGLDSVRGTPAAFGDFNNDGHTDLFVISSDQKTVETWVWDNSNKEFSHLAAADITTAHTITNVVPGDFDMDGRLDLLVQGQQTSKGETFMSVYLGDGAKFNDAVDLPSATEALPFAFDYNGDGRVDFLGRSWDQRTNATGPQTWVWQNSQKPGTEMYDLTAFVPGNDTQEMCQPASPHSSAFVDLDGDCLADLFIVCDGNEEYQIWTNSAAGFVYSQTGKLPTNAGPVSFADINADGSLDLVIPIPGKSQIYVL
ncbi:hypothetical protein EC988_001221, partial [Linderina pennispora]